MKTHLVWLRNDLRLNDNPALYAACQDPDARVIALYIATPGQWQQHDVSGRQLSFIRDSLQHLSEDLSGLGIPLLFAACDDFTQSVEQLSGICHRYEVTQVFYNYQYELNEHRRDQRAEQKLAEEDIVSQGFHDGTWFLPAAY